MELSAEERAILAHLVVAPDAWVTHALEHGGEAAVREKIDRWRDDYLAVKDLPGYMTRAQRDAYKSPEQIAAEAAALVARQAAAIVEAAKAQSIADNLPSRAEMLAAIDKVTADVTAATTLAMVKPAILALIGIVRKMGQVVYWLARNKAD